MRRRRTTVHALTIAAEAAKSEITASSLQRLFPLGSPYQRLRGTPARSAGGRKQQHCKMQLENCDGEDEGDLPDIQYVVGRRPPSRSPSLRRSQFEKKEKVFPPSPPPLEDLLRQLRHSQTQQLEPRVIRRRRQRCRQRRAAAAAVV